MSVLAREVGRANDCEIDTRNDKDSVTYQIDPFDVVAYAII
jgi:hypothetical protein